MVGRIHEQPAHQVDPQDPALPPWMDPPACSRRVFREIGWPQETGVAADIGDDLALIPDVIAGRQDVDPTIVELAAKAFGQAETPPPILAVYHPELDVALPPQAGH